ncbi:hypothetical protein E8E12_004021 [Didymella heteroderae]|uniref:Heterokaryon incompatibility domain-containing protein n=1 Tax=Didymella heteroderae TaxID=1769908 RepID=A0A9P4WPY1_9PLEO|nr:hypothetical protein E8E12_004021 [Didymella heteroderae]
MATKASWAKLTVNIPLGDLPSLFQDAIIITRQLGLRYLWIDSLCIIQDSLRDWETEAAKMASIYQNSYVTISATNASDSSARCLTDRRKAVKIPYENTTKKEFALRARVYSDHHPDANGNPAKPTGPLTLRAWALQEHVLSSRILHFTATELVFEWDKLPAISGIASKIRKATHSEYIAGLWKSNLAFDLLWQRAVPTPTDGDSHSLETWRAPTFSWSSLNAPVTYYTPDDDERQTSRSSVNLVSSTVIPTGFNALGAVSDASLTLRGPTATATLSGKYICGSWNYTLIIEGTNAIEIAHDCCLVKSRWGTSDADEEQWTIRRAQPKDILAEFEAPVLCLSVARYNDFMSGIVLGRSERKPGSWERLGAFAAGTESLRHAKEEDLMLV